MTFIPNSFIDELRGRISIVDIIRRSVKLTRKGRDWWGCCPFHHEKTPSFTVNDEKGFYHCFGCSEHGDVISFEMKANHLSFVEAAEKLAAIAGMDIPKSSPQDKKKEAIRVSLFEVMEKACAFFETRLSLAEGKDALEYVKNRDISDETIKSFRLGYAPSGSALREYLTGQGVTLKQMEQAGLCATRNGNTYDYFRNRLMFPILDRRGKVIAFGGRIIGDGEPKYLNSPESDLFRKSQVLYAFDKARAAARKNNSIIVVEGYMDVIALHQAGIRYAVAPLGTALTEAQILMLWQAAGEPVLCFDGDKAGRNAALRAVPRALPVLKEGHSLRFAWMPEGRDPDDIVRTTGTQTFLDMIKEAQPLADIVWKIAITGNNLSSPEKKAEAEKKITEMTATIQNESIRRFYAQDLKNRLYDTIFNKRFKGKKKKKEEVVLRTDRKLIIDDEKLKNLIAYILTYPEIAGSFIERIAAVESRNTHLNRELKRLIDGLMGGNATETSDDAGFALNVEMLRHKYRKEEYPEPTIAADIDRELKSLSLVALNNDIKKLQSELISTADAEKMEILKNLIAEKAELERDLGF